MGSPPFGGLCGRALGFPRTAPSAREGCPGQCGTLFYGTDSEKPQGLRTHRSIGHLSAGAILQPGVAGASLAMAFEVISSSANWVLMGRLGLRECVKTQAGLIVRCGEALPPRSAVGPAGPTDLDSGRAPSTRL